ncbi:MAG: hypothetical protein SFZ03_01165 [Candidatus Melainabacteria bacterium]|nr:hypothetical protein [Candidatus Melainabacteria bacterium]
MTTQMPNDDTPNDATPNEEARSQGEGEDEAVGLLTPAMDESLSAYLDGQLSPEAAEQVEALLKESSQWLARYGQLRQLRSCVQQACACDLERLPETEPPLNFWQTIGPILAKTTPSATAEAQPLNHSLPPSIHSLQMEAATGELFDAMFLSAYVDGRVGDNERLLFEQYLHQLPKASGLCQQLADMEALQALVKQYSYCLESSLLPPAQAHGLTQDVMNAFRAEQALWDESQPLSSSDHGVDLELLSAYVDGELAPKAQMQLSQQLERLPEGQQSLAAIRALSELLQQSVDRQVEALPPLDFWSQILPKLPISFQDQAMASRRRSARLENVPTYRRLTQPVVSMTEWLKRSSPAAAAVSVAMVALMFLSMAGGPGGGFGALFNAASPGAVALRQGITVDRLASTEAVVGMDGLFDWDAFREGAAYERHENGWIPVATHRDYRGDSTSVLPLAQSSRQWNDLTGFDADSSVESSGGDAAEPLPEQAVPSAEEYLWRACKEKGLSSDEFVVLMEL